MTRGGDKIIAYNKSGGCKTKKAATTLKRKKSYQWMDRLSITLVDVLVRNAGANLFIPLSLVPLPLLWGHFLEVGG